MAYLIGTLDIGEVRSERYEARGNLINLGIPGQNKAFIFDFLGAERKITLEGVFIDSAANARTFIGNARDLIDGAQITVTYRSDASSTSGTSFTLCYVNSVDCTWREAEAKADATAGCMVTYRIELVESMV